MPYTHAQLWELAQSWYAISDSVGIVPDGVRASYKFCADELTELIGPLAFAAGGVH